MSQATLWPSDAGESTSLPEASRARTSVAPDAGLGFPGLAPACGTKCSASCARCDPLGSSLRTFLLSACEALTSWSLVWKRRAIPSCRLSWWVLGRSGRRTSESGPGSSPDWPTPMVNDATGSTHCYSGGDHDKIALKLPGAVRWWPTAHGMGNLENPRRNGPTGNELGRAVTAEGWPTPTARITGATDAAGREGGPSLAGLLDQESRNMNGKRLALRLNPAWVEQLMGAPEGWTDLPAETVSALWATRTSRSSRS